jgi:hypothetical protein
LNFKWFIGFIYILYCSLRMETLLIPQRASGTRSPYTEEEMYYLTHPETWKAQNAVVVAEVEVPLVPPLPRRQNAVGVAEVEAPHMPPLPRRQNAVLGAVGAS